MLNILVGVGQQHFSTDPEISVSPDKYREQLLNAYVAHVFDRKGNSNKPFSDDLTRQWLAFLAKKMKQHNQTQ